MARLLTCINIAAHFYTLQEADEYFDRSFYGFCRLREGRKLGLVKIFAKTVLLVISINLIFRLYDSSLIQHNFRAVQRLLRVLVQYQTIRKPVPTPHILTRASESDAVRRDINART